MKYVISAIGGKQVKLEEGKMYKFDRFDGQIRDVLFYRDGQAVEVGTPNLPHIKVEIEKVEDKKDKKVEIRRYRAKSRYRKKKGHRQPVSIIKVKSITAVS